MKRIKLFLKYFFFYMLLIINLTSCDYVFNIFSTKQNYPKPVVEIIDFSSVDAYPLLKDCEQITSRNLQKDCFYKLLSKQIELSLSNKNIVFSEPIETIIKVKIIVSSKGIISVKFIDVLNNEELKNTIIQSIETLPQIKPAIKNGIPVTTEFILPIVLVANS